MQARLDRLRRQKQGATPVGASVAAPVSPAVDDREQRDREIRERLEAEEARKREGRALGLWEASGVPARHAEALQRIDFDTDSPWLQAFHRLRDRLGSGALMALIGQGGRGKTQLAAALIRESCKALRPGVYVKTSDVFDYLLDMQDQGKRQEARAKFQRPGLLVLDELHERHESPYVDRTLKGIIDHRYDAGFDTLLIANQDRPTFASSIGISIGQRLAETGECIVCDWQTYRTKG